MKLVPTPSGLSWDNRTMTQAFLKELSWIQLQALDGCTVGSGTVSLRTKGGVLLGNIVGAYSIGFNLSMFVSYTSPDGEEFHLIFTQANSSEKWEIAEDALVFEDGELDSNGKPLDDNTLSRSILWHLSERILHEHIV